MKKIDMTHFGYCLLLTMVLWFCGSTGNKLYAQDIYANQLISNSSDFQNPERITDANYTNYGHLSNLLSLLSTSYIRVKFPVAGNAGDVINIVVMGTGQVLGADLLDGTTLKLYDAGGTLVKTVSGSNLLQLSLLAPGTGIYGIKLATNITDNYTFTEARIEFNNVLTVNLLNEFRIYSVFYQQSCPPVYANAVFGHSVGGLLTSHVTNADNAVSANVNDSATLVVPLNALGLLDPAYLDLSFSSAGHAGEYVGFTVSQASTILDLGLVQQIKIEVYGTDNLLKDSKDDFNLLDLKLLSGTGNRYTLGFVTQSGNYNIGRIRIIMGATVGLFENLNVYNGFHYTIQRPPVYISADGPTTLCSGGSVTLTAYDSLGSTDFVWNTGETTASITVTHSGTYYVTVSDPGSCTRNSVPIEVRIATDPLVANIDSVINVNCADPLAGAIYLSAGHGAAPYTYLWSNGATTEDLLNVAEGDYSVTITDSWGCTESASAHVGADLLGLSANISDISCYGMLDGSISVSVSSGSGSYSYLWSTGSTSSSVSGLGAGEYTVDVTDDVTGCSESGSYTITEPDSISISALVVNDTCTTAEADGSITLSVTGGTSPYAYEWLPSGNTAQLTNLPAGTYTVTVTDDNGCTQSWSGAVLAPECDFTLDIFNVITPNGDGANDTWIIQGLEYYPQNEVKVFDKWGDLVFEKRGYDGSWSGTKGMNGPALPDGTYFYLIKLNGQNIQGGKNEFTGSLLIQR